MFSAVISFSKVREKWHKPSLSKTFNSPAEDKLVFRDELTQNAEVNEQQSDGWQQIEVFILSPALFFD